MLRRHENRRILLNIGGCSAKSWIIGGRRRCLPQLPEFELQLCDPGHGGALDFYGPLLCCLGLGRADEQFPLVVLCLALRVADLLVAC